jgi:DNA-binding XRE family transcriptional regulator
MSALTENVQIIQENGRPAFAVIPYLDFVKLSKNLERPEKALIPHEVVKLNVLEGYSMVRAWRTHLKINQAELAKKAGMTQAALSQIEKSGAKPRAGTLKKLAEAMSLTPEHFI